MISLGKIIVIFLGCLFGQCIGMVIVKKIDKKNKK